MARDPKNTSTLRAVNLKKKRVTSISCELELAIWSRDTGQRIPYFDRCQLMVAWMFNIRVVHSKPRLHMVAMLRESVVLAAASHDNHQLMGFLLFPIWVWGSAWQPFGSQELFYELDISIAYK